LDEVFACYQSKPTLSRRLAPSPQGLHKKLRLPTTYRHNAPRAFYFYERYGCIVVIGDVMAEGIADGIADDMPGMGGVVGVVIGGMVGAIGDAMGPIDSIGEAVGTGCAEAASVAAPATKLATKTMPTNHRFTEVILLTRACYQP
jgi:hypothetical protein